MEASSGVLIAAAVIVVACILIVVVSATIVRTIATVVVVTAMLFAGGHYSTGEVLPWEITSELSPKLQEFLTTLTTQVPEQPETGSDAQAS